MCVANQVRIVPSPFLELEGPGANGHSGRLASKLSVDFTKMEVKGEELILSIFGALRSQRT